MIQLCRGVGGGGGGGVGWGGGGGGGGLGVFTPGSCCDGMSGMLF